MAYRDTVLGHSPFAYYRMGEASGGVVDAKGGASGTVSGTVVRAADPLINEPNGSIDFNGSTGYVTVTDAAGFSLVATGQLTLEALISPDAIPNNLSFIHKGAAGQYEYNLAIITAGTLRFICWDIDGNDRFTALASTTTILVDSIYHVVVTLNDSTDTAKLYVNGVLEDTETTWVGSSTGGTAGFVIGRRDDTGTEFFDGRIDEVAVYPTELTLTQVVANYAAATTRPAGAASYATFPKYVLRRVA